MNTEAMHFLISFLKEYLGDDLEEIKGIEDHNGSALIEVKYRLKEQTTGTYYVLNMTFKS